MLAGLHLLPPTRWLWLWLCSCYRCTHRPLTFWGDSTACGHSPSLGGEGWSVSCRVACSLPLQSLVLVNRCLGCLTVSSYEFFY